MATLLEMTASIVASHASSSEITTDDLILEIRKVHASLRQMEETASTAPREHDESQTTIPVKKAFQYDQIICMICGKSGMKTLARHLTQVHGITPREYRKQFGISGKQPLTARKFSESRKKLAQDIGLATNLAKARAVRAANLSSKHAVAEKSTTPKDTKQGKKS